MNFEVSVTAHYFEEKTSLESSVLYVVFILDDAIFARDGV